MFNPKLGFFLLLLILKSDISKSQNYSVYGTWKITKIIFVAPPNKNELNKIWSSCVGCKVVLNDSVFLFKSNRCFLFKTVHDFKITSRYSLTRIYADTSANYADKTIECLFDDGKRDSIDAYKTFNIFEGRILE
jgi:hypothetical protein